MKNKKQLKLGYTAAVLSAICFGSSGLFVKYIYRFDLTAAEMLILQYSLAIILLWGIGFYFFREKMLVCKNILFKLLVLGVVGNTLMTLFYYRSFKYLDVAVATIMLFTYPIIIALYNYFFATQKMDKKTVMALVIAFIGSFLVLNLINYGNSVSTTGIMCGLLGALFYAFMHIYSESFLDQIEPIVMTTYVNTFSLITLVLYFRPFHLITSSPPVEAWYGIIVLAVLAGVLPVALLYTGIKNIGAVRVSIIANFEIPVSAVLSFFIYGERLNLYQIMGMGLVLIGIYILQTKD